MRRLGLLLAALLSVVIGAIALSPQTTESGSPQSVSYCRVISNPAAFDGARVKVRAVFDYGFEWSELLCMECRSLGGTWLDYSPEGDERSLRRLEKAMKAHGAVAGTFTGVFHNQPVVTSASSYKFKFIVEKAEDLKVLIKERDWKTRITDVGWCERRAR